MLEIVKYNQDEYQFPCLLVLGCFDGIHTGHAELLKKARLQAKINGLDLGVMVMCGGKGKSVYTLEERLALLEENKVKFVLETDFTEEFKNTKPLEFLSVIEEKLNVKAYMSGKDFRFGEGAKGKSSTLKNYCEDEENGVWYMPVKDVMRDGKKISTSDVKNALAEGDIKTANELLGRNFSVSGTVCAGAGRGAEQVVPTMNVKYPESKTELKRGVYAVECNVRGERYKGIANYGARPTFDDEEEYIEVYLDGFSDEVHGEEIKIEFVGFLREIQKFESAQALKEQIALDMQNRDKENIPRAEDGENGQTA